VLTKYADQISKLEEEHSFIAGLTNSNSPIAPPKRQGEEDDALIAIQARILELTSKRDREIKHVWNGFAARWGPGTIGIQTSDSGANVSTRLGNEGRSSSLGMSSGGVVRAGRMKVDWIRPDLSKKG